MATAIKSPTSHYDTLQVAPTATDEEIARAFALQMRVFRLRPDNPLVHVARLNTAYQTLCDPLKRKAYDASIGLGRKAEPWTPEDSSAIAPVQWLDRRGDSLFTVPGKGEEPKSPAPSREMRFATFIAESLRQPAFEPEPQVTPDPSSLLEGADEPEAAEKPHLISALEQREIEREQRSAARSRAMMIGAGVVGLGVLGILGVTLGASDVHSTRVVKKLPENTVTVPLPPPAPAGVNVAPAAPAEPPAGPLPQKQARATETVPVNPPALSSNALQPEENAGGSPAAQSPPAETAPPPADAQTAPADTSEPVANPAPVASAGAKLPLPDATVARTIEHIGYACGQVVSTTAVQGGAPNVFKVTCSSGDSYQATPVHGRYHFRRLGSH